MNYKYVLRFFENTYDEEGDVDDEKVIAEFELMNAPIIPQIDSEVFFKEKINGYRVLDVSTSYPSQDEPEAEGEFTMIDVFVEED